jgi:hypothetical protein
MPKNKVSDPITDEEIAFARLVLSGTMTDRQAAEAVSLHPDSAAYTKSKPRVRAYMLERRRRATARPAGGGGTAPSEPGPRTSPGPPLGNRQPQPRYDPRQHHRPGQGPLHDHRHGKLHPRPSRRLFGKEVRPCARPANRSWLAGPSPHPLHLRQPHQLLGSPDNPALCPPVQFCPRPGSSVLDKEPLRPPSVSC